MILSATVMVTSLEYAIKHNLKMSIPYLSYYATITCCRAFLYTIPENTWSYSKNGNKKFLEMSHSTIINCTGSYLNRLDTVFAENTKKTIKDLKEWRELFSYKFPSSGLSVIRNYDVNEIIEICSIMCELAQLSSEQIQKYVSKKCMYNYEEWAEPEVDLMEAGFMYNDIIDPEDAFRVRYLSRKQPSPVSIYYTMTEGMVEDYFGAWQEEGEDNYDPDEEWQIIFPVP
ncbi:hypothetical protein FM106_21090 [Brachybacterium faecium]|nr:hypothetical protein FM106_21090 [Brachybacterium faecium]